MNKVKTPVYWQKQILLPAKSRGFHLITQELLTHLSTMTAMETGLLNLFLLHTSASLLISENTCNDVALDLETHLNRLIPDDNQLYRHTLEGEDDMPAHIKNALLGASLTIPIQQQQLCLGQWQGIFLCEHRNHAPARQLILTAHGI